MQGQNTGGEGGGGGIDVYTFQKKYVIFGKIRFLGEVTQKNLNNCAQNNPIMSDGLVKKIKAHKRIIELEKNGLLPKEIAWQIFTEFGFGKKFLESYYQLRTEAIAETRWRGTQMKEQKKKTEDSNEQKE